MPALKVKKKAKKGQDDAVTKDKKPQFRPGPFDMKPPLKGLYLTHPRNAGRRGTLGQPCDRAAQRQDPSATGPICNRTALRQDSSATA